MAFTFVSVLENFNNQLWQYHLPVPEAIAAELIQKTQKRVICNLNDSLSIHAALMKSEAYWFILINKKIKQQLYLSQGDQVKVTLEQDMSTYGHEMPEELETLMEQDELGRKYFHQLTKGKQRSLLYLVNKVKSSQSRINKALAIVEHLKEVKGELDYKKLNEKIKFFNNLYK